MKMQPSLPEVAPGFMQHLTARAGRGQDDRRTGWSRTYGSLRSRAAKIIASARPRTVRAGPQSSSSPTTSGLRKSLMTPGARPGPTWACAPGSSGRTARSFGWSLACTPPGPGLGIGGEDAIGLGEGRRAGRRASAHCGCPRKGLRGRCGRADSGTRQFAWMRWGVVRVRARADVRGGVGGMLAGAGRHASRLPGLQMDLGRARACRLACLGFRCSCRTWRRRPRTAGVRGSGPGGWRARRVLPAVDRGAGRDRHIRPVPGQAGDR